MFVINSVSLGILEFIEDNQVLARHKWIVVLSVFTRM